MTKVLAARSTGGVEKGWADFGQVIRRYRKAARLSQEALAERSGLHWTYISEIETSRRNPSIDVLRRLAAGLQVPLSRLIAEAEMLEERPPGGRFDRGGR